MKTNVVILLLSVCLLSNAQPPIQKFWALNQCNLIIAKLSQKPTAAYSLRKLNCNAVKAVNVRRDADNATQDIGFTQAGDLDQTALLNFVNGAVFSTSSISYTNPNSNSNTTLTITIPNAISITGITNITGKMDNDSYNLTASQTNITSSPTTIIVGYAYSVWWNTYTNMAQAVFTITAPNTITIKLQNPRYASGDQTGDLSKSYYQQTGSYSYKSNPDNFDSNGTYIISTLNLTLSGSFSGNGYVTTWYDQSGKGNNLTQTTQVNQPQIVNNGSVNTENGRPTIRFMDTSDEMLENNNINIQTFSAVRKALSGGTSASMQYLVSVPINVDFAIRSASEANGSVPWYYGDNNSNDFSYNAGGAMYVSNVATYTYPSTLHCLCANSGTVNSNTTFSLSSTFNTRGMYGGDPVSELIVFPGVLSVNDRTRLYTDQKKYYGTP
ncbi:MAG: hypothetical protein Q8861_06435 [Bacteroidota bacterium]|nr:hypothetical protein [Bacteroidota bacterium]